MDRFLRVLNVQPDETRVASRLFLYSFFFGLSKVFQLTAAQALFLEHFQAGDLAYVYIIASVATVLTSAAYLRIGRVVAPRPLILGNIAFCATVVFALWLALIRTEAGWPAMALMVWFQVLYALVAVAFWSTATQVVDIRQGKRLFPVVTTGDVLAVTIGGYVILQSVDFVGTENLVLVGAIGLLLAGGVLWRITSEHADRFQHPEASSDRPSRQTEVDWNSPYLRLMMAYFMLSAFVFVLLDNAFLDVANNRYSNDLGALARFFALYNSIAALVTFFFRSMGAGRMVQKFGLIAGLLGLPLALLIGSSAVAIGGTFLPAFVAWVFWLTVLTRLSDKVFRGVQATSFATLYQPLMEKGPSVQATLDGIIDSLALGAAGLLLLVLHRFFDVGALELSFLLVVLCGIWVVVTFRLRREYVSTLARVLHRRRIKGEPLQVLDGDVLDLVQNELDSKHDENVVYALQLLQAADYDGMDHVLVELLHHESTDVRKEVLARIEERDVTDALEEVRRIFADDSMADDLRGRAIRTVAALSEEILPEVMEALRSELPDLRRGALVGLLKSGSIEGVVYAGAELLDDLRSSGIRERIFAAQVLRDSAIPSFYRQAIQLLNDRDPRVRRAAIEAAAKMAHPPLWPLVVDMLRDPELSGAASQALSEAGPEAVASLLYGFERHTDDPAFRLSVIRLLGWIGTDEALSYLAGLVHQPDRVTRQAALTALAKTKFHPSGDRRSALRGQLQTEIREAAQLFVARADVEHETAGEPLLQAIEGEIRSAQHRIFLIIRLLFPDRDVLGAWESFQSQQKSRRAYALEFLENCVSNEDRALLFPVLEDLPKNERLDRLSKVPGVERLSWRKRLLWLQSNEQLRDWTRLCARKVAARHDLGATAPTPEEEETYRRTLRLKEMEFFGEMDDHVLAALAPRLVPVDLSDGDPVFREGEVGDSMYLVDEGRVRIFDSRHTLATLDRNSVFGEFTVLHAGRRTASVTAEESTRLFRFTQADLYDLLTQQVGVARALIHMIVTRLRENQATRATPVVGDGTA